MIENRKLYELSSRRLGLRLILQDIYDVAEQENVTLTDKQVERVATMIEEMDFGSLYELITFFIQEAQDEDECN